MMMTITDKAAVSRELRRDAARMNEVYGFVRIWEGGHSRVATLDDALWSLEGAIDGWARLGYGYDRVRRELSVGPCIGDDA